MGGSEAALAATTAVFATSTAILWYLLFVTRQRLHRLLHDPRNVINSEAVVKKSSSGGRVLPLKLGLKKRRNSETERERFDWEISYKELKFNEVVGRGNFGEVFRGRWLGTEVAIKTLKKNLPEHQMTKFMAEISLLSSLHHPNIVIFMGACITPPHVCLVMEFLPRGNLYDYLHDASNKLDMTTLHRFATDTARGMKYLHHRCNVVQRDLKSSNLLIDDNLTVKLCDFGLSRYVDDEANAMTHCGTPFWTAPEIIRQEEFTEKADVYSFGIILWEIVTQQVPYEGRDALEVAYAAAERGLRPTIPSVCPDGYPELMTRCWQDDPAVRPGFDEVLDELFQLGKRYKAIQSNIARDMGSQRSVSGRASPVSGLSSPSDSRRTTAVGGTPAAPLPGSPSPPSARVPGGAGSGGERGDRLV